MKEPYLLLIGAYERDNFGDLLFAKIFDKVLNPYLVIKGSLIGRDLTDIGGDSVVSAVDFLNDKNNPPPLAIIHCGGETLTLLRQNGISMNLPPRVFEKNWLFPYCEVEISKKIAPSENPSAYIYSYEDFEQIKNRIPIAFVSIGGSSFDEMSDNKKYLSSVKHKLKSAKYISVRDKKTKDYLKNFFGIDAKLYPDVVSVISRTHADKVNQAIRTPEVSNIIKKNPYILFQAKGELIESIGLEEIAEALNKIIAGTNLTLVMQPAGLASGHGSIEKKEEIAKQIKKINPRAKIIIQRNRNLWNQVAVIANAQCCIGTSLHIRVVAASFAKPCVSLQNKKVTVYAESWEIDEQPYDVSVEELPQAFKRAIKTDSEKLKQTSKYLADRTEEGLKDFMSSLKLKPNHNSPKRNSNNFVPVNLFRALSLELDRLRETLASEIINKKALEVELNLSKSSVEAPLKKPIEIDKLRRKSLEAELNFMKSSKSWKLTAPFRIIEKGLKKLIRDED